VLARALARETRRFDAKTARFGFRVVVVVVLIPERFGILMQLISESTIQAWFVVGAED
jgi:hypothetical protein